MAIPDISPQKRALVSYMGHAADLNRETYRPIPKGTKGPFVSPGTADAIVRALIDLDYTVDVFPWDTMVNVGHSYDLFFGHLGRSWMHIARQLPPRCVKVFYAACPPWDTANRGKDARIDYLNRRRGFHVPYFSDSADEELTAYAAADGIICLGNKTSLDEFASRNPIVRAVPVGTYPDDHFDPETKDFLAGRSRFFFFGAIGNIRRGLDLLLDAFSGIPEAELYISTILDTEFCSLYARELSLPNIHYEGYERLLTSNFYQLVDICDWDIYPSSTEGQSGSVLDCMGQGVIPIVTEACHIDVDGCGLLIHPHVEDIRETIREAMRLDVADIKRMACASVAAARTEHTPEAMYLGIRKALEDICSAKVSHA